MTDSPNRRDSMIERVRKLSRMTIANGASETEASMAASKMAALIAEYDIGQSELTIKVDAQNCVLDEFIDSSSRRTPWTNAVGSISKLFGVRCYFEPRSEDLFDIGVSMEVYVARFYGFPTDVAAAIGMCTIIHNAIGHESDLFVANIKGKRAMLAARESFELGMADRLKSRIMELVVAKTPMSQGRGLIVLKDQLVTDQWAQKARELGLRLRPAQSIAIRDRGAFAAGHVKGGSVALNQAVGHSKRLGHG